MGITDKMLREIITMREERTMAKVTGEGTIAIADKINGKNITIQQNNIKLIITQDVSTATTHLNPKPKIKTIPNKKTEKLQKTKKLQKTEKLEKNKK